MAIKRIGEGDRVRRPANYQDVGGNARKHVTGTKVSAPTTKPGKPSKGLPGKPLGKEPKPKAESSQWYPSADDDIPEAGGHPSKLRERAEAKGRTLPTAKSLTKGILAAPLPSIEEDDPEDPELSEDFLDGLTKPKADKHRSGRTDEEADALVEQARKSLPILRNAPVRNLTADEAVAAGAEDADEAPSAVSYIPKDLRKTSYSRQQERSIASVMIGLPGVVCANCAAAESCPKYEDNATCAYEEDLSGLTTRDANNMIPALEVIADLQLKRGLRGVMLEARVAGGQLDPNVTRQLAIASDAIEKVARLKVPMQQASTKTTTVVSQDSGVAKGGGVFARLLAGFGKPKISEGAAEGGTIVLNPPREELDDSLVGISRRVETTVTETTVPIIPGGSDE
jgi:hypothetical protein